LAVRSGVAAGRADLVADFLELGQRTAGHRPFHIGIVGREIFGDEAAGEPGGAIDDDVELAIHLLSPRPAYRLF
jgi:hypothetical protein